MAELLDESSSIESTTLNVYRTSATVKGGRRFSFGALVVVGDRNGKVGVGYGKSREVPQAVEKAQKYARKAMKSIPMSGKTLPHEVEGHYSSSKVRLIPASPGTGVVAGGTVRAILEMAGVTDCLTKCYGSTNARNMVKAVFDGLSRLRTREYVEKVRGKQLGATDIENIIASSSKFATFASQGEKMRGPVNTVGGDRKGGRGGGGRRRGPGGDRGGDRGGEKSGGGAPEAASGGQA